MTRIRFQRSGAHQPPSQPDSSGSRAVEATVLSATPRAIMGSTVPSRRYAWCRSTNPVERQWTKETGMDDHVAVLGIGAMGHGMATSALRSGLPTIVWNRNREATRDLEQLGAEVAEKAADAARRAAIVVTMVTDA